MAEIIDKRRTLVEILNMIPDELVKPIQKDQKSKRLQFKMQALSRLARTNPIDIRSKLWKKLSELEINSPINSPFAQEIAEDDSISIFQDWSGVIEINPHKTITSLKPELKMSGVIFSDISILYEEQGNLLETFTNQLDDRLNNRLNALTAATANLGVVFQVPKNMVIEKPFKIVIKIDGFANYLPFQFYINLQRSSSAKLVIEFISEESTSSEIFSSTILDGKLEDAASLNLVEIQALNSKVLFFPNERILLEKNAILNWFLMDKGSLVTQRTLSADNSQHGAEAKITGVYIPSGNQHFYYDTKQNQLASDTISNLLFKGVLDEASFALWQGNILVKNGTHGADGYQLNNNLILSPSAYVQSIPGLEISTDDVKCSHGVTISDVDKEQLFYLKSRGIKESQGKALIVDGFIRAAINRIKSTELQNYVIDFLGTERTDI